ncbi:P-loop NTPase fold protein [Brevundimonas sp. NPDC092305]|uniref:KAP family P-loop NTPase fold protein n=1 Tax=Brevundimonas sp. NPDC092305 TaxID=3363957 RepID=UPI00381E5196
MDIPLGQVERPIETAAEDRLERRGFVGRVADALVAPATQRATGVVIGITGSWGSGKSSILNLVESELRRRQANTVVVRFDPWLISGRDDLIAAFLHELAAAFNLKKSGSDALSEVASAIDGYAGHLAPAVDLVLPGWGKLLKGAASGAARLTRKDGSLAAARKAVVTAMEKVKAPVVVLIDELDRVEDGEVRTMAQLIRSVADFPNISYLLAYDAQRVAEALAGAPNDPHGRGRSYLEKIVQLPIPLPILLPAELVQLIRIEITRVHQLLGVKTEDLRPGDHDRIIEVIVPDLASTPRDIKRMVGAYHALAGMLLQEVDLADVLGLAALTVKTPRTVELIRRNPEGYVVDPLSFGENARRAQRQPAAATSMAEGDEAAQRLLVRLFPALSGQVSTDDLPSDAVGLRRNLLTALRLGALPGESDRESAETLLTLPAEAVQAHFQKAISDDAVGPLMDRLDALYPARAGENDLGFWTGVSRFLDEDGPTEDIHFGLKRDLADALSRMLLNAVRRRPDLRNKALTIHQTLRRAGDRSLTARWLHQQLFVHGALGARHDGGAGWFVDATQIENEVRQATQSWARALDEGVLLGAIADQYPLLLMLRADWTTAMRSALVNQGGAHIDRLARIFYGGSTFSEPETVDALVGWVRFMDWIEVRMRDSRIPDDVREAFHKAREAGRTYEVVPEARMKVNLGPRRL